MEQKMIDLEQQRKKTANHIQIAVGSILAGALFLIILTQSLFSLILPAIAAIVAAIILDKEVLKYKVSYKEIILKSEVESLFENVVANFEKGFTEEQIKNYCIVSTHDRFYSDDYIEATYKNCRFKRSDIKIEDVRRSGKHTTVVTTFQGPWMIFEFPKHFSNYTVVKEKGFLDNGAPGGWLSSVEGAEKLRFEDQLFNETFVVYSTDGPEAFYLLTPHFMERLMEVEKRYDGRVYFGFINNQFHVVIDNRTNYFEPSVFEEVTESDAAGLRRDLKMIIELIELMRIEQMEEE